MGDYYLDTSALAKRYIVEMGRDWVRRLTAARARNRIFFSQLAMVELEVALARKVAEGTLSARNRERATRLFRRHLRELYNTFPISDDTLQDARTLVRRRGLPASSTDLRCPSSGECA